MLDVRHISKIGIGAWGLGGFAKHDLGNDDNRQITALVYSFNKGLNLAEVNFWNSEGYSAELISKALRKSSSKREDIFIVQAIYSYNNETINDVALEFEKCLDTFETAYIDTLQFPLTAFEKYGFGNVVNLVGKYLMDKKIRFTSLTNCNLEYLKKYHRIFKDRLFSHELHYSFEIRENEKLGIIDFAVKHGIKNVIFQPLRRNRTAKRNWPLLVELAGKYGKTQNQIILNWLIGKGFLPLVKSENTAHIAENLGALDFRLTTEDIGRLNDFTVPNYKEPKIDWFMKGDGTSVHALPNVFDEWYP